MTLTDEQEERLRNILGKLKKKEADAVLAGEHSFVSWLKNVAYDIYQTISSMISQVWNWLRSIFE